MPSPEYGGTAPGSRLPRRLLLGAYLLLAAGASLQEWILSRHPDPYTHYNNYVIFRQSFAHLVGRQDLYTLYPGEHWDYFRYSPAFALAFGAFAWLPDVAGLLLWNVLNAGVLFAAWMYLPLANDRRRLMAAAFVAVEMMTALQNAQSNVLIAGLVILAFGCLERRRFAAAAGLIAAAAFTKLFALAAFALIILYPDKRRFLCWAALWTVALALLPLAVVPPTRLAALYASWARLLSLDFAEATGLSVFGWLHAWFHVDPPKLLVVLAGALALGWALQAARAPAALSRRLLALSNVLIWVVIFNHKAESSTYVIAVCGVAIWVCSQPRRTVNLALAGLAFVFTELSATAIFPFALKNAVFVPYAVKAVPCIAIWLTMTYDLSAAASRDRPATLVACQP